MKKFYIPVFFMSTVFFLACSQKATEEGMYQKALAHEEQEEFDEAFEEYEALISEYPEGKFAPDALQKLAFMNYNQFHKFDESIRYHRHLVEKFPESEQAGRSRFMIGYIYANDLQDPDQAKKAYEEFLTKHPEHELVESVNWELEHLGQDVNQQLEELFGDRKTNGDAGEK